MGQTTTGVLYLVYISYMALHFGLNVGDGFLPFLCPGCLLKLFALIVKVSDSASCRIDLHPRMVGSTSMFFLVCTELSVYYAFLVGSILLCFFFLCALSYLCFAHSFCMDFSCSCRFTCEDCGRKASAESH